VNLIFRFGIESRARLVKNEQARLFSH
jgi:hypothetical protein